MKDQMAPKLTPQQEAEMWNTSIRIQQAFREAGDALGRGIHELLRADAQLHMEQGTAEPVRTVMDRSFLTGPQKAEAFDMASKIHKNCQEAGEALARALTQIVYSNMYLRRMVEIDGIARTFNINDDDIPLP